MNFGIKNPRSVRQRTPGMVSVPVNGDGPALPALRGLNRLKDLKPTIVIDTREQTPLVFRNMRSVRATLQSADYSVAGLENSFSVERKSISDLVSCVIGDNRERFERELHRLRGFQFARLLIVGREEEIDNHNYRSNIDPKVILHTLRAFEVRYVPVVWAESPAKAAELIESWAFWYSREIVNAANDLLRGCEEFSRQTAETEGVA